MTDSPQTELHWYVAKTFRRERKIKERLEILGIEHFIPFHKVVKQFGARRVAVEEPIVNGIIFIRYDFRGSIALVNDYGFEMRYLRNRETRSLLVVPDKQMEDFIFLLSHCEDQIEFVSPDLRPGDRVRVTEGQFKGIEGELLRIKGHKRVVIRLQDVAALATVYIPGNFLEKI